jgi:AraC-like DNA-binding protein
MALLRRGDLSVTDVCFAVGCSSPDIFSTRCTELVGVRPSTYRHQTARATAGCGRARRNESPDRSGIEKHGSRSRN